MPYAEQPPRPLWMTALALFCFATVIFLAWRDFNLEHVRDVEVWFGLELRGRSALATAPLHWAIFLLGGWAFWTQQPWILPVAAAYELYIAVSHLVWNTVSPLGHGWLSGIAQMIAFSVPAVLLLYAHRRSQVRA